MVQPHYITQFLDADLEIAQEINYEAISDIEIDQRLHFQATSSISIADQLQDSSPKKHFRRQVKGYTTSPKENSIIQQPADANQPSSRNEFSSFGEKSLQTKLKQIKAMPLPEREYTWKDGLRGPTSSHTKNLSLCYSSRNMSYMSVPIDISKIEGTAVHDRLYKENFELRKKRESIYDPFRKERIVEQTFSFSPNRMRDSNQNRSTIQFIQDQRRLELEKEERMDQLRVQMAQTPQIAPAMRISKEQAEETKLKVKQKFEQNKQKILKEVVPEFKPRINQKSLQMVINKQINRVESPTKQLEQPKAPSIAHMNKKSEEMVYQRFKKDYDQVIAKLGQSEILNKQSAIQVIQSLGFASYKDLSTSRTTQLVNQLLSLGIQDYTNIKIQILFQLLCEIQQLSLDQFLVPLLCKGQLMEYYPLVLNRKSFIRDQKIQKVTTEHIKKIQKEETMSPRLNTAKNKQILSQTRQAELKVRLTSDQKVKTEILSSAHNKDNLQWIKNQLDELEMLDCTFKPKTNTKVFSEPRVYDQSSIRRENKRAIDIEFQLQERECTFKPAINVRKQSSRYVPGSKGDIISPGKPKVQQPCQSKLKKEKGDTESGASQLIQLNVRISDVESRQLVVRSSGTFELSVREFCEENGLDFDQEQTLISVISQNTGWPVRNPTAQ